MHSYLFDLNTVLCHPNSKLYLECIYLYMKMYNEKSELSQCTAFTYIWIDTHLWQYVVVYGARLSPENALRRTLFPPSKT